MGSYSNPKQSSTEKSKRLYSFLSLFGPNFLFALPTLNVLVPAPATPNPLFYGDDFYFFIVLLIFSTL